jgi:hypothetical protein
MPIAPVCLTLHMHASSLHWHYLAADSVRPSAHGRPCSWLVEALLLRGIVSIRLPCWFAVLGMKLKLCGGSTQQHSLPAWWHVQAGCCCCC